MDGPLRAQDTPPVGARHASPVRALESLGFRVRDACADDRDEVLALTAHTWETGDYIRWVFDDWLADRAGRFLVAEDAQSGRIAAIDKLSFLSPTEAWFQGLRVLPDFRGRGLAGHLERYMLAEAARLGARTARFLSLVDNKPVYRNAFRHGFAMRFVVRHWKYKVRDDPGKQSARTGLSLRPATPAEVPTLYEWWTRSSSWQATEGLVNRQWSFGSTSAGQWAEAAEREELLVAGDLEVSALALPPPLVLFATDDADPEAGAEMVLAAVSATRSEWQPLAAGLVAYAGEHGINLISGLLPDSGILRSGLERAGFVPDPDEECLAMFELRLNG